MSEPLKIGVTCYPTFGGSGVVATELGIALARRGHQIHFIAYDIPRRLQRFTENIFFHEVEVRDYPVFIQPPYGLSLTSKMVEVAEFSHLDILHVHYAIPHATSAYLARQILKEHAPKIITTLHGTDITVVGNDPSYMPITRFSIAESDGITVPSQYLKRATYEELDLPTTLPIEVIPNFVNTEIFHPAAPAERKTLHKKISGCEISSNILVHVSNFRAVKRLHDVVEIFDRVQKQIPSHLILVGDGPERSNVEKLVRKLGLSCKVCFLGKQDTFWEVLQCADVFLLPSQTESFGLAALEAMSCGVPVVASNVGGIPEVVTHGENGFLAPVGDVNQMATYAAQIIKDRTLFERLSKSARDRAVNCFSHDRLVGKYEDYFYRVLGKK